MKTSTLICLAFFNDKYQFSMIEPLIGITVAIIFVVGVYIHLKKIQICRKEKDATWKLEVTNSITVIIHCFNLSMIYGITHFVSDLYSFTGEWLCYFSKMILSIGDAQSMGQSFMIAFTKLLIIVYAETDMIMKERIRNICFYLNIFYGIILLGVMNLARPDFVFVYHSSMADRCLGGTGVISRNDNTSSHSNLINLCDILRPEEPSAFDRTLIKIRTATCWLDATFIYLNAANILEAFFYIRIFIYMQRYVYFNRFSAATNWVYNKLVCFYHNIDKFNLIFLS